MTDLTKLTLADAVDGLKAKTFSSEELTQAFLTNIEASNPTLNAYIEVTADKAIEQARASDARLTKGEGGALEGAPLGIRTYSAPKACRRPPPPTCCAASCRRMNRRSPPICGATGRSCWAS